MLAGVGIGLYANLEEAVAAVVHIHEEPIRPMLEHKEIYEKQYEVYKQLYDRNKDLFPIVGSA